MRRRPSRWNPPGDTSQPYRRAFRDDLTQQPQQPPVNPWLVAPPSLAANSSTHQTPPPHPPARSEAQWSNPGSGPPRYPQSPPHGPPGPFMNTSTQRAMGNIPPMRGQYQRRGNHYPGFANRQQPTHSTVAGNRPSCSPNQRPYANAPKRGAGRWDRTSPSSRFGNPSDHLAPHTPGTDRQNFHLRSIHGSNDKSPTTPMPTKYGRHSYKPYIHPDRQPSRNQEPSQPVTSAQPGQVRPEEMGSTLARIALPQQQQPYSHPMKLDHQATAPGGYDPTHARHNIAPTNPGDSLHVHHISTYPVAYHHQPPPPPPPPPPPQDLPAVQFIQWAPLPAASFAQVYDAMPMYPVPGESRPAQYPPAHLPVAHDVLCNVQPVAKPKRSPLNTPIKCPAPVPPPPPSELPPIEHPVPPARESLQSRCERMFPSLKSKPDEQINSTMIKADPLPAETERQRLRAEYEREFAKNLEVYQHRPKRQVTDSESRSFRRAEVLSSSPLFTETSASPLDTRASTASTSSSAARTTPIAEALPAPSVPNADEKHEKMVKNHLEYYAKMRENLEAKAKMKKNNNK